MRKFLWTSAGMGALGLGVVGVVTPLLPTVPFILLAAFCFAKGSERWHRWLYEHPRFGPLLQDYAQGRGIPVKIKIRAIAMVWIGMSLSAWIIGPKYMLWAILGTIGLSVSLFLWTRPTPPLRPNPHPDQPDHPAGP